MRHPLHPALVHFPIACWSLAVVSDFASLWLGESAWRWSGGLLAVGCVVALAAMLAGLMEFSRIPEGPAMRDAYLHMTAMLVAFSFSVGVGIAAGIFPAFKAARLSPIQALRYE